MRNDNLIQAFGLGVECPFIHREADCPILKLSGMSPRERLDCIRAMPPAELDELLRKHMECARRQSGQLLGWSSNSNEGDMFQHERRERHGKQDSE